MKTNVLTIRWSAIVAIGSLLLAIILYSTGGCNQVDFATSILLAIFGSGFMVVLVSSIGYCYEKKRTLEEFSKRTRRILYRIKKYNSKCSVKEKAKFFQDYDEMDKNDWDALFASIYFLCDFRKKDFKYIYNHIYRPIQVLNEAISMREPHFRWFINGETDNNDAVAEYIKEVEELFMVRNSQLIEEVPIESVRNSLVEDLLGELNGRYYEIMYGKTTSDK